MNRTLLRITVCLGLAGSVVAANAAPITYEQSVVANNPYLYYRFGETSGNTVADFSGNGRNGTNVGGPALGQPGVNGGDTGISYDGVNDYTLSTDIGAWGANLDNHTVELVFSGLSPGADNLRMLGVLSDMNAMAYQLSLNSTNSNGNTSLFYREGFNNARVAVVFDETEFDIYDGGEYHMVFTFDQSRPALERFNVFINGVQLTTSVTPLINSTTAGNDLNFTSEMAIGARNDGGTIDGFSSFTIDELALYSTTLSAADVAANYAALVVPEPAAALTLSVAVALTWGSGGYRRRA
ncbi:MAG: LamG-like jellyroll fold domain-containing protein [Planctomycetota bacterium]